MFWLNFFLGVACTFSVAFCIGMVMLLRRDYLSMRAAQSVQHRLTWQERR